MQFILGMALGLGAWCPIREYLLANAAEAFVCSSWYC
jgi:hypothetical protein